MGWDTVKLHILQKDLLQMQNKFTNLINTSRQRVLLAAHAYYVSSFWLTCSWSPSCSGRVVIVIKPFGVRSRSLTSLKPEISQALDSLLDEIHTTTDAKILRSTASQLRLSSVRAPYSTCQQPVTKHQVRSCPLCKQAGRNDRHFLSKCTHLPAEDRAFLAKTRLTCNFEEVDPEDSDFLCSS